jgi:hypothetical protein
LVNGCINSQTEPAIRKIFSNCRQQLDKAQPLWLAFCSYIEKAHNAICDRIVYNSHTITIKGESMRKHAPVTD